MADALVLTDYTVYNFGQIINNAYAAFGLHVHLYTNNLTPTKATVLGDFTEATFPGYASQTAAFPATGSTVGHAYVMDGFSVTFTHTPGADDGNVYGYYIVWDYSGELLASARFTGAPVDISALLTSLAVAIVLTLESKNG